MTRSLPDVVVFGSADWGTFWYQTHQVPLALARKGHRVFYFNRTLQQWPRFQHFLQRTTKAAPPEPPQGIRVLTPWWLPPHRMLRPFNRVLIRRTLAPLGIRAPIVITYCPTFNILDALEFLEPSFMAYVNVHNYDHDRVLIDLLAAEMILARKADLLLADSLHHRHRMERVSGGRKVGFSLPGVHFSDFRPLTRREPPKSYRKLYYYGGIGPFLDFDLYNALAEEYPVTFLGKVDPRVKDRISPQIRLLPPVPHRELASHLKDAEVLTYFRTGGEFARGVLPAKFFECMATGLPFLCGGLPEMAPYRRLVHDVGGSLSRARRVLGRLSRTETAALRRARIWEGEKADWDVRMRLFLSRLPLEGPKGGRR